MNRYESYVPIQINYKPFLPDFEKWASSLVSQQQNYDKFMETADVLSPSYIEGVDDEERDIWGNYITDTKEQLKSTFARDVREGNKLLKNKTTELRSQIKDGLYGALETRYREHQINSKNLQDQIKDQPQWRQEHFKEQYKVDHMGFDKGKFNHINPVTVEKDPESQKRLTEYVKSILPPEVGYTDIQQTDGGAWTVYTDINKQGITSEELTMRINSFISANPDIARDFAIKANYTSKRLDPETKTKLTENFISSQDETIELAKQQGEEYKNKKGDDIVQLKKRYNLADKSAIMTEELKEKIDEETNQIIKNAEENKTSDINEIIRRQLISDDVNALYPLIPNKYISKTRREHDPYLLANMNNEAAFARAKYSADRADARQRRSDELFMQQIASDASQGVSTPSRGEELTPTDIARIYNNTEAEYKESGKTVEENMNTLLGFANDKEKQTDLYNANKEGVTANVYKAINKLPSNFSSLSPKKQKQALDDVGMGNVLAKYDGPQGSLVAAIDNLKQTIPVHRAASQRFNSMQGQLGEELVNVNKEIAKAKQKYKDWNFTTEDGKQVTVDQAFKLAGQGKDIHASPFEYAGNFWSLLAANPVAAVQDYTQSFNLKDEINEITKRNITNTSNFKNAISAMTYVDEKKTSEFYKQFNTTYKTGLVDMLNQGVLNDIHNSSEGVLFKSKDNPEGQPIDDIEVEKITVHPLFEGSSGFLFTVTDKEGKTHLGRSAAPKNPEWVSNYSNFLASAITSNKLAGNNANVQWLSNYYSNLNNNIIQVSPYINKDSRVNPITFKTSPNGESMNGQWYAKTTDDEYAVVKSNTSNKYYVAVKDPVGGFTIMKENGNILYFNDGETATKKMSTYTVQGGTALKATGTTATLIRQQNENNNSDNNDYEND